ncbi:hypothetical protein PYCC9005_001283 [Savitreella phatthalungensis]
MSLLRRASSFMRQSEAERELKQQEKEYHKQLAKEKKEKKLESRRSHILQTAASFIPSDENRGKYQDENYTAETPFKASERHNPLNERRDAEKLEEERKMREVSDRFDVNLSEAKVMLARDPDILSRRKRLPHANSSDNNTFVRANTQRKASTNITSGSYSPEEHTRRAAASPSDTVPSLYSPASGPSNGAAGQAGYFAYKDGSPSMSSAYSESVYTPRMRYEESAAPMQYSGGYQPRGSIRADGLPQTRTVSYTRSSPLAPTSPVVSNEAELYDMAQRVSSPRPY